MEGLLEDGFDTRQQTACDIFFQEKYLPIGLLGVVIVALKEFLSKGIGITHKHKYKENSDKRQNRKGRRMVRYTARCPLLGEPLN